MYEHSRQYQRNAGSQNTPSRHVWFPIATPLVFLAFMAIGNTIGMSAEPQPSPNYGAVSNLAMESRGANESLEYTPADLPEEYDLNGLVRRTIGISVVLIAACLGCLLWTHTRSQRFIGPGATRQHIELMESTAVAPKCFLHLIDVDGQRFLVSRDVNGLKEVTPLVGFPESLEVNLDGDRDELNDTAHRQDNLGRETANGDDVPGGHVLSSFYESRNLRRANG